MILIKACSTLRLTHQIRLAAFMAHTQSKRLLLVVKQHCELASDLDDFAVSTGLVEVKRG